jgi:hypothetical protein
MSGQLSCATHSARTDGRKKKRASISDSDDSDELAEKPEEEKRIKEQSAKLRQTQDDEQAIKRQLDEQCAKNAKAMQQLSDARNKFPVYYIAIRC